jgi:hypothetical protein
MHQESKRMLGSSEKKAKKQRNRMIRMMLGMKPLDLPSTNIRELLGTKLKLL